MTHYFFSHVMLASLTILQGLVVEPFFFLSSLASLNGTNVTFTDNLSMESGGGAIFLRQSVITSSTTHLYFTSNRAKGTAGGAISGQGGSLTLGNSTRCNHFFSNNSANLFGGAIYFVSGSLRILGHSHFAYNSAIQGGGAIYIITSLFVMYDRAFFARNVAAIGGAILIDSVSINTPNVAHVVFNTSHVTFVNNSARIGGGGIACHDSTLIAEHLFFTDNTAGDGGGGIGLKNSTIQLTSASFTNNSANNYGGAIAATKVTMDLYNTTVIGNSNGAISVIGSTMVTGTATFSRNHGDVGGAITAIDSIVSLKDHTLFDCNKAIVSGGAIAGFNSQVVVSGVTIITNNEAGIGGALQATNTDFILNNTVNFTSNSAIAGGAIYFSSASTLTLEPHTNVTSSHNHASKYGGVIYYEDAADSVQCDLEVTAERGNTILELEGESIGINFGMNIFLPSCFIDLNEVANDSILFSVNSYNDTAGEDGSFLYGGLLSRCQMNINLNSSYLGNFLHAIVPYTFLRNEVLHIISLPTANSTIKAVTSKPYQLCFCESDYTFNCSRAKIIQTTRGQKFNVSVLATDQGNSTTSSQVTAVLSPTARLKLGQTLQAISQHCTDLTYNLYSTETHEQLILYPDGPCRDTGLARAVVNVTLLPCPDAFTQSGEQCVCEERLQVYDVECVIDEKIYIERKAGSNFWMSAQYVNGSYEGLILYRSCPADYCTNNAVNITLDNFDIQCDLNRGELLCGACATNYSLLLSGTQCQVCSNAYLALLLPFAAAGIGLVVFLSVLRLTVATGMINSIILYANIVQANRNSIFPSTSWNILTVFIAWMNLDLGFQTCFYHGMDAYAQTWLQFAFPVYVWILISLIILTSRYSVTMSKLIGHNPIAVLATLLLMSYTKILKIIIEVYSSVDLDYPGNKTVTVWLKDANVPYLKSKHLLLSVVTSLILVFIFLPYTLLLLLGYKLYHFSGRKQFLWLNRVKPLLDSYYAPYKIPTRYWTGFLLLVRCALYIVFSFNSLGGTTNSFLSINITFTAMVVLAWLSVLIYKNFYNNVIEASVYLNLITLSAAFLAGANSPALVYSLVGMVFATMIGIIVYHFHLLYTAQSAIWMKTKVKLLSCVQAAKDWRRRPRPQVTAPAGTSSRDPHRIVTETVIDLREPILEMFPEKENY